MRLLLFIMLRSSLLAALLLLPSLPAAAAGDPCAGQSPDRCWAFRCPPAGTQVAASDGSSVEYLGVVAGDPRICRARASAPGGGPPEEISLVFGVMFWGSRGDVEAERRAEADRIAPFFPARPGHSITISTPSSRTTWSLRGIAVENTPVGRRRVVRITQRFEQPLPGQPLTIELTTYALDAETGAVIGGEVETRRGREVSREPAPAMTRFTVPAERR